MVAASVVAVLSACPASGAVKPPDFNR